MFRSSLFGHRNLPRNPPLLAALARVAAAHVPVALACSSTGVSLSAQAPVSVSDRRPVSLEARVRALEAELAAARQSLRALAAGVAQSGGGRRPGERPPRSPTPEAPPARRFLLTDTDAALAAIEERLDALDQQIRVTQRLAELEREKAVEDAKTAPRVTAGREGFSLQSADKAFQLKLRGYTQADGRFYTSDRTSGMADTFVMRRVRPILEGTIFGNVDFRIMPDFGEGRTVLQDAYADLRFTPALKLRAGKFKSPFGLERLISAQDLLFVDRALPTALVPNRDVGVMLFGDVAATTISYAVGAFNGVPDGGSGDIDDNPGKDVVGRVFVSPFKNNRNSPLQQLGIGLAASIGERQGTTAAPGLPSFKTTSQLTFARYRTDGANTVIADGRQWRVSPQAQFYLASFGAITEYVVSSQDVRQATVQDSVQNRAWQVSTSYVLTGEPAAQRIVPRRALDPKSGGWGAVEVTARYHTLELDKDFLSRWSTSAIGVEWARAWDTGVNWYLNRGVKLSAEYQEVRFRGGASDGDRPTERGVLTRVQVGF